jgi:rhodanese-related sulfurtransferase
MIPESRVLEVPAADAGRAAAHFKSRLEFETDASDLHKHLKDMLPGLVVVDARKAEAYERGHIPGALNIHHASVDEKSTALLSKTDVVICYCSGVGCNASTKAALNFAALGFSVKELIGGIAEWEDHDYPVATGKESGKLA